MTRVEEAKIIQEHEKLIRFTAKRFVRFGVGLDDLLQEGRMALLVAIRSWRQEAAIWTYARRFVMGAMVNAVTKTIAHPVAEVGSIHDEADLAPNPEDMCLIRQLFAALTPDEQRIVVGKLVQDMTVRELAEAIGMSKSDVDRSWHSAVGQMRAHVEGRAA